MISYWEFLFYLVQGKQDFNDCSSARKYQFKALLYFQPFSISIVTTPYKIVTFSNFVMHS